jgi:hypothetical protein
VSFKKEAVSFYTKGKGKDRKVIPITSSSGRFSMSSMTSTLTSMPKAERERKRDEVVEKYYHGDREAFEKDVETRPQYVGRLLLTTPTVQKFKRPTPKRHFKLKPERKLEEPKEKETELENYFYNKLKAEGVSPPKKAIAPTNSWWLAFDAKVDANQSTKENKKNLDPLIEMIVDQEKRKEEMIRKGKPLKLKKEVKPPKKMSHIEMVHLLSFSKRFELDAQEIDKEINYYENKKHLEDLASEKGFSFAEVHGFEEEAETWTAQYDQYLGNMKSELELAGYQVIGPNNVNGPD